MGRRTEVATATVITNARRKKRVDRKAVVTIAGRALAIGRDLGPKKRKMAIVTEGETMRRRKRRAVGPCGLSPTRGLDEDVRQRQAALAPIEWLALVCMPRVYS